MTDVKYDAILKRGELHNVGETYWLVAEIYNDSKKRFRDGSRVRTSRVIRVQDCPSENGMLIYTENSVYLWVNIPRTRYNLKGDA